jgi:hypothetical protein
MAEEIDVEVNTKKAIIKVGARVLINFFLSCYKNKQKNQGQTGGMCA